MLFEWNLFSPRQYKRKKPYTKTREELNASIYAWLLNSKPIINKYSLVSKGKLAIELKIKPLI
jgi:hypothetical protein